MKREKPCRLAYRLAKRGPNQYESRDFAYLHIEIMLGETYDAAKEYDARPDKYHLERLEQIRSEGSTTKYFRDDSFNESKLDLQWLTSCENYNQYGTEWFACKIEGASFTPRVSQLLGKLVKATGGKGNDTTVGAVIEAMHAMGAKRVKYANNASYTWIFLEPPNEADLALPWKKREETTEAA